MSEPTREGYVAAVRGFQGSSWLVGVVKRSYEYSPSGRLSVADRSCELINAPSLIYGKNGIPLCVDDDADVVAPKAATDVVVRGSAFAVHPRALWDVGVAIGRNGRRLKVCGERRAAVSGGGVRFSDPAPTTRVPLRWELAYGGYDAHAQGALTAEARVCDLIRGQPACRKEGLFAYPRNRVGRAYFIDIDRSRTDGAWLPQIEDSSDLLTPDRFFVSRPRAWIDAPVPGALWWVPPTWYPRIVRVIGAFLEHETPSKPIKECSFADGGDLACSHGRGQPSARALQGAAPGLAAERLHGNETVLLEGLDRESEQLRFDLPGELPSVEIRPPGVARAFQPGSVLQTVRIDTESRRIVLTWCAGVRLLGAMTAEQVAATMVHVVWRRGASFL